MRNKVVTQFSVAGLRYAKKGKSLMPSQVYLSERFKGCRSLVYSVDCNSQTYLCIYELLLPCVQIKNKCTVPEELTYHSSVFQYGLCRVKESGFCVLTCIESLKMTCCTSKTAEKEVEQTRQHMNIL